MERQGVKLRYVAATNAGWQLVANRNARLRQTKQLVDKMVAMTRHSATDLLTDLVRDSAGVKPERVFKVQINDLGVRMQMLQNNEMDALWMPEPLATEARVMKHGVLADTRTLDVRLGVMAFRDKEMARRERQQQLQLLVKAYDRACDTINKYGVAHFRKILTERYKMKPALVDSLPGDIRYEHCTQPRQQDVERARQWLDQLDRKGGTNGNQ
jgi:NitT/TauT family transport system substrate-binding protein